MVNKRILGNFLGWTEKSSYGKCKSSFPYENFKYFTKTSCHQAHWKKDRDKRKNLDTNFFAECWQKNLFKAISNKLKTVLPTLISSQQTAHVKNRFIGESGRLISDIIEISGCFNITGFLVTVDIEKAFDSLDHSFLIPAWKSLVLGKTLLPG